MDVSCKKNIGGNIMSKGWYPVIDYDKCVGCMKVEAMSSEVFLLMMGRL